MHRTTTTRACWLLLLLHSTPLAWLNYTPYIINELVLYEIFFLKFGEMTPIILVLLLYLLLARKGMKLITIDSLTHFISEAK